LRITGLSTAELLTGESIVASFYLADSAHTSGPSATTVVDPTDETGSIETLPADPQDTTPDASDTVRLAAVDFLIDVDIDSDNSAIPFGAPAPADSAERDFEDQLEGNQNPFVPGKLIPLNDGDTDGDGIPDSADGFDLGGIQQGAANAVNGGINASARFVPLELTLSPAIDVSTALFGFTYDWSSPVLANLPEPSGDLRIWKLDGDRPRTGTAVSAGGDFVNTDEYIPATDLGFTATKRTVTLYVEGVNEGRGFIQVDIRGPGFSGSDRVKYDTYAFAAQGTIEYGTGGKTNPVRQAIVTAWADSTFAPETLLRETHTDDQGRYVLALPSAAGGYPDLTLTVRTASEGGPSAYPVAFRDPEIGPRVLTYTSIVHSLTFAPDPGAAPTLASPVANAELLIGNTTTAEKAFWVFDAAVTTSRFNARYEYSESTEPPVYFAWPGGSNAFLGVHINGSEYGDWDDIIHELGHNVAWRNGFYPTSDAAEALWNEWGPAGLAHTFGVNQRTQHPEHDRDLVLKLAFTEGWSNFFSMAVQAEEPIPAVEGAGGDPPSYGVWNVEHIRDRPGYGEDEEVSVMRILWDLYDPAEEVVVLPEFADYPAVTLHDNVALGYQEVYNIVSGLGTNQTLDALWDALVASANGDVQKITDYGAIFEMHNVSPSRLVMTVDGVVTDTWDPSSGDSLVFQWRIPQGNPTLGPIEATGSLLTHFGVKVFDAATGELVHDTGLWNTLDAAPDDPVRKVPFTTQVQWVPSALERADLSSAGTYRWVVYGSDFDDDEMTGPYLSDDRTFAVED
jgi:hypothetical protein